MMMTIMKTGMYIIIYYHTLFYICVYYVKRMLKKNHRITILKKCYLTITTTLVTGFDCILTLTARLYIIIIIVACIKYKWQKNVSFLENYIFKTKEDIKIYQQPKLTIYIYILFMFIWRFL